LSLTWWRLAQAMLLPINTSENQKCNLDFQRGGGELCRYLSFVVLDILTATTFRDQNEKFSVWSCGLYHFAIDQNDKMTF